MTTIRPLEPPPVANDGDPRDEQAKLLFCRLDQALAHATTELLAGASPARRATAVCAVLGGLLVRELSFAALISDNPHRVIGGQLDLIRRQVHEILLGIARKRRKS
jgi:hypothetical protein